LTSDLARPEARSGAVGEDTGLSTSELGAPTTRPTPVVSQAVADSANAAVTVGSIGAGPGSEFEFRPHNCFACGSLNAHGLQLVLHVEHARAWTELTLDRRFEGWEGIVHGGILCTILDEVMAWSLVATDNWGLTARMTVSFVKPVLVGRPVRAEGTILRVRRRLHETTSRIVDLETGATLATGEGTYVAADEARKRELQERYLFRTVQR